MVLKAESPLGVALSPAIINYIAEWNVLCSNTILYIASSYLANFILGCRLVSS